MGEALFCQSVHHIDGELQISSRVPTVQYKAWAQHRDAVTHP